MSRPLRIEYPDAWYHVMSRARKGQEVFPFILNMFSRGKSLQMATYKRFVAREEPLEIMKHYSKKNLPSVLGSEKFIEMVKSIFSIKKKKNEIPESKRLCPEAIDIKKAVCRYYKIKDMI